MGLPNRSKSGTKNELILGPGPGGPREGRATPGGANVTPLGARGETTEGGTEAQKLRFQNTSTLVT